jgi:hypothetical protein
MQRMLLESIARMYLVLTRSRIKQLEQDLEQMQGASARSHGRR